MRNFALVFAYWAGACHGCQAQSSESSEAQRPVEAVAAVHGWPASAGDAKTEHLVVSEQHAEDSATDTIKSLKVLSAFLQAFNPEMAFSPSSLGGFPRASNIPLARCGGAVCRTKVKRRLKEKRFKKARDKEYAAKRRKDLRDVRARYTMDNPSRRMEQVSSFLRQRMAAVIVRCAHRNAVGMKRIPPAVDLTQISVTDVKVAPNLLNANVYVAIGGDRKNQVTTMRWLRAITPVMRYEFGVTSGDMLKKIPEFWFIHDDEFAENDISRLLEKLTDDDDEEEDSDEEDWEDYGYDFNDWDDEYGCRDDLYEEEEMEEEEEEEDEWLEEENEQLEKDKTWMKDERAVWEDDMEAEESDKEIKIDFPAATGPETEEESLRRIFGKNYL